MKPRPSRSHVGSSSRLRVAGEPRVLALLGDVGDPELLRDPRRLLERGRLVVRRADGADLALVDELLQRAERLLERRLLVLLVVLVEVDVVGLQAPERRVERAADEAARAVLLVVGIEHRRPTSWRARPGRAGPAAPRRGSSRCRRGCRRRRPCRRRSPPPRAPRRRPLFVAVGIDPAPEVVAAEPDDGDLERPECARPHASTLLTHARPASDEPTTTAATPRTAGSDPRTRPLERRPGDSPRDMAAGRVRTARWRRARAASCRG